MAIRGSSAVDSTAYARRDLASRKLLFGPAYARLHDQPRRALVEQIFRGCLYGTAMSPRCSLLVITYNVGDDPKGHRAPFRPRARECVFPERRVGGVDGMLVICLSDRHEGRIHPVAQRARALWSASVGPHGGH